MMPKVSEEKINTFIAILKPCENINNDESVGAQYRQITHMASQAGLSRKQTKLRDFIPYHL